MSNDHRARSGVGQEQSQRPPDERPDLGPLRAVADHEEFAEAKTRLVSCYSRPLKGDDPLLPLAHALAQSLTEAGFTLHHCSLSHPLYRLGGVCLLPVPAAQDQGGRTGVVVSWTTHDLLSHDWDRWAEYHDAIEIMSDALAFILGALGYEVVPFGVGGASLVTGRRGAGPVAR